MKRLQQMTAYCRTRRCLRQYILQYFGEFAPDNCNACYNCLHNFEEVDISREARAIVRCISETGQNFGIHVIAETLCGADTDKVRKYHMEKEDTYGILSDLTQEQVRQRINCLLEAGVLEASPGPYPVLWLTEKAEDVVYGTSNLTMRAAKSEKKPAAKTTGELEGSDGALFQRLRTLRGRIARIQGVPAYVVFSDKTLRELAVTRPRTMAQLRSINGVGTAKAERYGKQLLAEIESFEQ
jgi:ATP-dependent DNA helicase RecQ